ncbi:MAG: hypothetical protein DDT42_02042 [candidate division WS2 bacterium]|uniref:Uncharacterized protein n=1 Tax=Psychracetigena formicireducens TaxID=2986056 RepID=A0A9E2F793_PSYF1|nr:hypothetical protein [Candidatus Psychracetigena formicireducens]
MQHISITNTAIMLKKLLFAFALLVTANTFSAIANPGDPGDPNGPAVPIDGGASILVAAGAAYAYRKMKKNKTVVNNA